MTHLLFLESAVSGAVVDDGVVVDGVGGLVLGRNQPFSQRRRFRLVVWQRRCTHSLDRYLSFFLFFFFFFFFFFVAQTHLFCSPCLCTCTEQESDKSKGPFQPAYDFLQHDGISWYAAAVEWGNVMWGTYCGEGWAGALFFFFSLFQGEAQRLCVVLLCLMSLFYSFFILFFLVCNEYTTCFWCVFALRSRLPLINAGRCSLG